MNRHANNIHIVNRIAERVARGERDFGRVYAHEVEDFVILNYTSAALFGNKPFSRVEEACRGLVIRKDGKVMAVGFNKFYNLGERNCPHLPDEPYTIWEKIDGSLLLVWDDGNKWRFSTRGRLYNNYTDFANKWWHDHIQWAGFPTHWTYICEVVIPDDRMPRAAYKPPGLYLLAIRDRRTGHDYALDSGQVSPFIDRFETAQPIANLSIDDLLNQRKAQNGIEGWVIRYQSGIRIKIKTAWYLRMFRALNNLTPKYIHELMIEYSEDWVHEFPDDLQPDAIAIQTQIERQYRDKLKGIYADYARVAHIDDRKEFALAVLEQYPENANWLFKLRDDRLDELDVLRSLELCAME